MPIAHITVAPDLSGTVAEQGAALTKGVTDILTAGLGARAELVQIGITAALTAPGGCDVLCVVHHRGSEQRSMAVRSDVAQALHDLLRDATDRTTRVRLIALGPDDIAAADSPEALA
ncbi:hypothetical protein RM543_16660 [Roseicyclus sp. F158]|uniref:Uncharacterized protein n=1 Tax=Tropicimonas omnivorans TaxID=3075590 RepID=A0ABU3DKS2_9RHOB|nr:hypothetical protein [Roseicyclus sp. F158]MDT0684316.1 hypothetical protein [Roseicyclus sp. F158]